MTDTSAKPVRRSAFNFLIVLVALDMIAGGIVVPVMPQLVKDLAGGDPATAARYIGLFVTAWAAMQFVFAPILGGLSDRFGRRPVLLLSLLGLAADSVLMALAPNLSWLFAARVISGALASSMATANAYIADVTPPDDRAARFGMLGAAWGVGFVLGPAIGGLLGELGPRAPFWGSAILAGLNLAYGFFVLPESLPKTSRAPFSVRLANPLSAVTFFAAKPGFALLGVAIFLTGLASQVLGGTWIPYVTYRYHWSSAMSGASLAAVGASYIVVQSLIVGRFVARFGELAAIYAGLLTVVAAYIVFAASPWTWLFMAAIPLFALGGLGAPGMQAILSREVSVTEQGRLQGARAGLGAIAGLVGPVLFTETFARSISTWRPWATPGAAFLLAAGLLLTAFVLTAVTLGGVGWRARLAASRSPAAEGEAL